MVHFMSVNLPANIHKLNNSTSLLIENIQSVRCLFILDVYGTMVESEGSNNFWLKDINTPTLYLCYVCECTF